MQSGREQEQAKTVSRLVQLTEGASANCSDDKPSQAQRVVDLVMQFRLKFPRLMQKVDESPYLAQARQEQQRLVQARANAPPGGVRRSVCADHEAALRMFIEVPNSRELEDRFLEAFPTP